MRKLIWSTIAALGVALLGTQAWATPLPPNTEPPVPTSLTTVTWGSTPVATFTSTFSYGSGANKTQGTVTEKVFTDTAAGHVGQLDFVYTFSVNPSNSGPSASRSGVNGHAKRLTATDYTGAIIYDAGYIGVSGGIAPTTVDRDSFGDVVAFNFDVGNGVTAGNHSDTLVFKTTSTQYVPGNTNLIDGGTATVGGFAPVGVVPEPSSLALLCTGILGMGGYAWRRRKLSLVQA
jgi:hypothetical protein